MINTVDLERQIINALRQNQKLFAADTRLSRVSFAHDKHRGLYEALVNMCLQGAWTEGPADELLLSDASGVSLAEMQEIFNGCYRPPTAAVFREWVGILESRIKTNKALEILASEAATLTRTGEGDPLRLNQARELLAEACEMGPTAGPVSVKFVSDTKDEMMADIISRRSSELKGIGITSMPRLTKSTSGIRDITGICGKPKEGKSTLVGQIAGDAADQGVSVLYFDFETGPHNLRWRDFSRRTGLSETDILYMEEYDIKAQVEAYKPGRVSFIRDHGIDRAKIQRYINHVRDISGEERVLAIFDSLQKLPFKKIQERRHEIDAWLRVFEEVKGDDPNLALIFTSELSREGGQPKESGDIEYTVDFLFELYSDGEDSVVTRNGNGRKQTIEVPDNGRRFLKLRLARDVEVPAKAIELDFDFSHWTFTER